MRNKTVIASFVIFCFLCLSSLSLAQESGSNQESEKGVKSLIRMDLLHIEREDPKLPGRNIFTPQGLGMREEVVQPFEISPDLREEASSEVGELSFSLRYIGYIDSGQKMVALVIFEGEAIAVQKGERISQQYTVGEITAEEIEIIAASGEKRQISLEGES